MFDAETELEYVPPGHGVGEALDKAQKFPGGQGRQFIGNADPTTVENVPDGHAMHVFNVLEPIAVEKRPAGHNVGVVMPKFGQYVPSGQDLQAILADCRSIGE